MNKCSEELETIDMILPDGLSETLRSLCTTKSIEAKKMIILEENTTGSKGPFAFTRCPFLHMPIVQSIGYKFNGSGTFIISSDISDTKRLMEHFVQTV